MRTLKEIIEYIHTQFKTINNEQYHNECGVTYDSQKPIRNISYCTNLTLDSVEKAYLNNSDLIITHHDSWDFIYGLKEQVQEKLKEYKISHFFTHLPLDDSSFGTNSSLLKVIGAKELSKHSVHEGFYCGALGEFEEPKDYKDIINHFNKITNEPSLSWKFNNKLIKKVFVVCGAGFTTDLIKEAVDLDADLYITGEKILYTMQYAQLKSINLLIGSHTFTEVFGVESLVKKITDNFSDVTSTLIEEEHLETMPLG